MINQQHTSTITNTIAPNIRKNRVKMMLQTVRGLLSMMCVLAITGYSANAQALQNDAALGQNLAIEDGATWEDVDWVELDQALENASEDRLIFIYVHATWCPYCGRMNTEILPRKDIQGLLSDHFETVRIDTDSKKEVQYFDQTFTEEEFAAALQNQSLPTVYFMTADGNVLAHQPGLLPVDVMAKLLEFIGTGAYKTTSYDAFEPTVIPQTEENP